MYKNKGASLLHLKTGEDTAKQSKQEQTNIEKSDIKRYKRIAYERKEKTK